MMKRTLMYRTAATTFLILAGAAPSCATPPAPGEVMMVVETDMSLPKDVDYVKIEVLVRGDVRFFREFKKAGVDDELRIPASLGVIVDADTDPTTPVTMRVTARQKSVPRVLTEVVTTIPSDRIAALRMPIQWLCWDLVKDDENGDARTTCPGEGQTCIAGSCVTNKVDSSKLDTFHEEDVFGGGTGKGDGSCFDVSPCFTGSVDAPVDLTTCTIASTDDVNVGIRVESAGICGPGGCFVVLDGKSALGWQAGPGGKLTLPKAVCDRISSGDAGGVSVAKVTDACALKTNSLPTCGPWSSVGTAGPAPGSATPVALVANQSHPVSLVVADGNVYWVNSGTSDKLNGTVKRMPVAGGSTELLASNQAFPKALTLDFASAGKVSSIYWATSGVGGPGGVFRRDVTKSTSAPTAFDIPGLVSAEGIAVQGADLFYTDFSGNAVGTVKVTNQMPVIIAGPTNGAGQSGAYRVAADSKTVFWTNETASGSVVMADRLDPMPVSIADTQDSPKELALDLVGDIAAAIFWTNYGSGEIVTASITGSPAIAGTPAVLFPGQASPIGIVVDGADVYWTNSGTVGGQDGTVMKAPKAGGTPVVIASGQSWPGAIAVDKDSVYWINQGSLTKADGAIMKLAKK